MKENISRFKIDYSVCKNSPGGSILEKVSNFQKELQLHEENSLHIYVKSPMVSVAVGKSRLLIEKLMK